MFGNNLPERIDTYVHQGQDRALKVKVTAYISTVAQNEVNLKNYVYNMYIAMYHIVGFLRGKIFM